MTDDKRFGRQVRLAEVGREGQALLRATTVALEGEGTAREIEARYLRGAGVRVVGEDEAHLATARVVDVTADLERLDLRHPAARAVGAGALRALALVRNVVLTREETS